MESKLYRLKIIVLVIVVGLIRALPCMAESLPAASEFVALKDVLEIATTNNPEIKAARQKWRAAQTRIIQGWYPEKPRVDIERMNAPDGNENNWMITQEIPFPTRLYLRGSVAKTEAEMAEQALEDKEQEVLSRVKAVYAMLFFNRHSIHIFEESADLMRRFAKVAEAKYGAGKASQGDALKAQVELSKMLNVLVTLSQEKVTNQALLNTLINRPPDSPVGIPEDPTPKALALDLNEVERLALKQRPSLAEAKLQLKRSEDSVSLARSEYFPDLMFQYRRRGIESGKNGQDVILGFTIPLWYPKQGAMLEEAKATHEVAKAEFQSVENMTRYDVKNLFIKVQTAYRLIELYRTSVLPQAEQALNVADAGYQSDQVSFLELLDAVRSLLDFRLEHYQHIAEHEQYFAELERVVGLNLRE